MLLGQHTKRAKKEIICLEKSRFSEDSCGSSLKNPSRDEWRNVSLNIFTRDIVVCLMKSERLESLSIPLFGPRTPVNSNKRFDDVNHFLTQAG
ncbi:hypothetical protein NPIL_227351 [Nephila pilipes]|uniref:Uncharacterized protein n=1 Tax=Nephila pilipes TaxID=299642 RepID=A0A8X6PG60_NEPPI|nr:hypothetical protein NPIL_227351 [Nephila pilipes]